jgi:predicted amidohydrolase
MLDILIKNGHVVDPTRNINGLCTIGVTGDKIVEIISENTAEARNIMPTKNKLNRVLLVNITISPPKL